MPNQMIALQSRNPQLPDPARQTAQFANFMNMAKQQEAAQRQSALAQQTMDINRAQEARAAALQGPALTKAQQDNIVQALGIFREAVGDIAEGDVAAAEAVRADLVSRVPGYDKFIPPASQWTGDTIRKLMLTSEKEIEKTIATPVASLEISTSGAPRSVTVGGLRPGQQGVYDIPETPTVAPRATPTAPQATAGTSADMRATQGANTTPQDLIDQGMDPRNIPSGMPTSPASFTRGAGAVQMTPEVAQQIVDTAVKTGMMAQADFDQLMALAPEQNKQPFMDMLKANNIALQPGGAGQQPQFADLRGQRMQSQTAGLRGAPPMEQTLAQMRTSTPLQQRTPNISTAPAETPEQAGRRSLLGRETPGEVYAKEKARARAQREAALEAGPKPLTPVQEAKLRDNIAKDYKSARSTISMMLDPIAGVVATVDKVRKLSPAQKEAITGYSGYLPSITPGSRSADTAIKNLRGKVTEMGKSAAALTGAIGQMAVQEWRIVSDMIASLDIEGMEPADLDNQLDIIEAQARRAAEVTRDAYENQYVEEFARYPGRFQLPSSAGTPVTSRPKAESQIPRIRGNADYNKLKPGTDFIDPNGVRRRKPK